MSGRPQSPRLRTATDLGVSSLSDLALVVLVLTFALAPLLVQKSARSPLAVQKPEPESAAAPPPSSLVIPSGAGITLPTPTVLTSGVTKFELTLSHEPETPMSPSSAARVDMSAVDAAVIDAFRTYWVHPTAMNSAGTPREVRMDVRIARDGTVLTSLLARASGQSQMDMSALRAAGLVKKIAVPLPAQFSGDSYEVQIHFQAE